MSMSNQQIFLLTRTIMHNMDTHKKKTKKDNKQYKKHPVEEKDDKQITQNNTEMISNMHDYSSPSSQRLLLNQYNTNPNEIISNSRCEISNNDPYDDDQKQPPYNPKSEKASILVDAPIIQLIKRPKVYMNHTYRDYSRIPLPPDYIPCYDINQMSFVQKLHHILSQVTYQSMIHWMSHGRAFIVVVPKGLESDVLPEYFGHGRYSSFLRQLSNHGFKYISAGPDRNCHYHELMLRGLPHLCSLFPAPKDSRRLLPDPENEPKFYEIAKANPVPNDIDYNSLLSQSLISSSTASFPTKRSSAEIGSSIDRYHTKHSKNSPTIESSRAPGMEYNNPSNIFNASTATTSRSLSTLNDLLSSVSNPHSTSSDLSNFSYAKFPASSTSTGNSATSSLHPSNITSLQLENHNRDMNSSHRSMVDSGNWNHIISRPQSLEVNESTNIQETIKRLQDQLHRASQQPNVLPEPVATPNAIVINDNTKPLLDLIRRSITGSASASNLPNNQLSASLTQALGDQSQNNQLQRALLSQGLDLNAVLSQIIGEQPNNLFDRRFDQNETRILPRENNSSILQLVASLASTINSLTEQEKTNENAIQSGVRAEQQNLHQIRQLIPQQNQQNTNNVIKLILELLEKQQSQQNQQK